jgi:hypothetical protein
MAKARYGGWSTPCRLTYHIPSSVFGRLPADLRVQIYEELAVAPWIDFFVKEPAYMPPWARQQAQAKFAGKRNADETQIGDNLIKDEFGKNGKAGGTWYRRPWDIQSKIRSSRTLLPLLLTNKQTHWEVWSFVDFQREKLQDMLAQDSRGEILLGTSILPPKYIRGSRLIISLDVYWAERLLKALSKCVSDNIETIIVQSKRFSSTEEWSKEDTLTEGVEMELGEHGERPLMIRLRHVNDTRNYPAFVESLWELPRLRHVAFSSRLREDINQGPLVPICTLLCIHKHQTMRLICREEKDTRIRSIYLFFNIDRSRTGNDRRVALEGKIPRGPIPTLWELSLHGGNPWLYMERRN